MAVLSWAHVSKSSAHECSTARPPSVLVSAQAASPASPPRTFPWETGRERERQRGTKHNSKQRVRSHGLIGGPLLAAGPGQDCSQRRPPQAQDKARPGRPAWQRRCSGARGLHHATARQATRLFSFPLSGRP